MDLKDIRELVKLIDKSTVNELEIRTEKERIRIAKNADVHYVQSAMPSAPIPQMPPAAAPSSAPVSTGSVESAGEEDHSNYIEVKSPMVGTYYSASSPDADPYVKVGDSVNKGQALCIIEAMKLMNEIQSEHAGKVAKIMVNNGDPVEYNQVLFLLSP
ncbi:MAG: acetyl-CoA carboxylase biotin carboxyl carrier protein [Calditrichaeota bacterium]|nr:acetyl-CoA carboxylase biotin carboxyl carrier protein [Calditrichota bacterium]